MSLTPNFGFNIPDSTDIVNLLTQCYPNFTLLDTVLQAIKETGVTQATESKAGTVHNIVRTVSACSLLWFTATSNFTTGDTFTVDGAPVSAVKVSGAGLETGDFVINSNVLAIVKGSVLTVFAGGGSSQIEAANVDYDNQTSGLSATNLQGAVDELAARPVTAAGVTYDNTVSGLTATDVQAAIDELATNVSTLGASVTLKGSYASYATAYTAPHDGYMMAYGEGSTSARGLVYGSNSTDSSDAHATISSVSGNSQSIFVKKGMKIHASGDLGGNNTVFYVPIQ